MVFAKTILIIRENLRNLRRRLYNTRVMDTLILLVIGKIILSIESLIKFIEMLSVPERQVPHISIISFSLATSRNIVLTSFGGKKELCDF